MRIHYMDLFDKVGMSPPTPEELKGHEDNVGEVCLVPLLSALGYEPKPPDIERKPTLRHPILGSRGRRQPDYGILKYEENVWGGRYGMVASVKPYRAKLSKELEAELCGWCALAGSLYGILTNGEEFVIIRPVRGVIEWEEVEIIPPKEQLKKELGLIEKIPYTPYDFTYAIRITEELTPTMINNIAEYCHNIIRSRRGWRIPKRLYEFTKLVLMRIIDERRFRERRQNYLAVSNAHLKNIGADVVQYYKTLFDSVKREVPGVFDPGETLEIDDEDVIKVLVDYLDVHALWSERVDVLGEIYERFLMRTMIGRELGDYFTPRPIINAMVRMVEPSSAERILDPACGTGGFLISSMKFICENEGKNMREISRNVYGIDIDEIIVKLCKINLWLHGNCHENIVRADSLDPEKAPEYLVNAVRDPEQYGFDVILTNPPFGRKKPHMISVDELERLIEAWRDVGVNNMFECAYGVRGRLRSIAPQSAFLELCIKALKPSGRLGIVVDHGLLSQHTKEDPKVRELIRRECIIDAVVVLPKGTFKPYGSNVYPAFLIMHKKREGERQSRIFRAEARRVGLQPARQVYAEDTDRDLRKIADLFRRFKRGEI